MAPTFSPFDGTRLGFVPFYREVTAKAVRASSLQGVILRLVLTDQEWDASPFAAIIPPIQPPIPPPAPGAAATAQEMTMFTLGTKEWRKHCTELNDFVAALITALPEAVIQHLEGPNHATPLYTLTLVQLMDALRAEYGLLRASDLDILRAQLLEPFVVDTHLVANFVQNHTRIHQILANNGALMSDNSKNHALRLSLQPSGAFTVCFAVFDAQNPILANQTWALFSAAVIRHILPVSITTTVAGYAAAAAGPAITPSPSAFIRDLIAAGYHFCYTHGTGNHSSETCRFPNHSHNRAANFHDLCGSTASLAPPIIPRIQQGNRNNNKGGRGGKGSRGGQDTKKGD